MSLQQVLDCHKSVFSNELGTFNKSKVKFYLTEKGQTSIPQSLTSAVCTKDKVTTELHRLQAADIIAPTKFSQWGALIVLILKKDGSVRICGDYKQTINRCAKTEIYPLHCIEELFATLSGGESFTTLDLSHAYLELELEEESQDIVTINTYKGL